MSQPRESIFEAVRAACYPATWSRGVELSRADTVVGESADEEEAVFRITTRGGMICPKVTLFPADLDWDCECASREPACEHVAAAVIAWRRTVEKGGDLPEPTHGSGRVGYRFRRTSSGLAFERVIVGADDEERVLEATLAAVADGRVAGPRFLATQDDLAVELALETHRRGVLPQRLVPGLFKSLAACEDVLLDGEPVKVAAKHLLPRVRVEDQGDGFHVRIEPDATVSERIGGGVVRCGDTLRFLGDPRLTARERDELTSGRHFGPSAVAELVTDVLPSLQRRLPVDISTTRLPETAVEPPRVQLDMSRSDRTLSVLATLVYGDPPRARIDGHRLVHLQGTVPLRDEKAERAELRRLRELGLAPGIRADFEGVDAVAFRSKLATWQGSIRGKAHEYFELAPPLVPRLEIGSEGFDISFESRAGGDAASDVRRGAADPGSVLRAWREGESLVPLMGGGWAPLPADWLSRFGHRIAGLLAAREPDGRVPRCCQPDLARLCEDLDEPVPAELGEIRRLVGDFEGIAEAGLPADLATTPRSYQRRGIDWLVFLREAGLGALLADDMGLGKTLQALCALRGRTLVVCPTSVLHNWADEIRTHRPALSHSTYHGPRRELDPGTDVTLTTYALLRLDADRLAEVSWDTVILDEAQNIKNPDSQVAAAAYRLKAGFRMTLTGTPVENRLDELWSQFHFINRGLLGGRRDFRDIYAEPISRGDAGAAARLRERIRPFLLRRMKQEVAKDLPPRTEMVLHCELTAEEREIYDAVRASTLSEVVRQLDSGGGGVLAALEALLRLRQAACHGGLLPGQEVDDSSKLRLLMEALDSVIAEGHKALVFSQWTSFLDLTEPHLRSAGMPYLRLDGSTRNRAEVVKRFQEDDGVPLMLISLKAGGTGLNLTAADHVFLLDPWWNPAVEDQAADRAHRIGQLRPVMIYRLVAEQTVEEKILVLQQKKRGLADAALGDADRAAGLTRDDLLELLR